MKLAVDSSVLLAIFNREGDSERWLDALVAARREARLVLCEVVYAEIAPAFASRTELDSVLEKMGARLEAIGPSAAWLAGQTFKAYRLAGGPRRRMIPDFLVAAHATLQADRLAAIDRGYLRAYFAELELLTLD